MALPVRVAAPAPVTLSQSTVVVGALLAFFVLYLAVHNRLGTYWQILTGGGTAASTPAAAGTTPGAPGTTPASPTQPAQAPVPSQTGSPTLDNFLGTIGRFFKQFGFTGF